MEKGTLMKSEKITKVFAQTLTKIEKLSKLQGNVLMFEKINLICCKVQWTDYEIC